MSRIVLTPPSESLSTPASSNSTSSTTRKIPGGIWNEPACYQRPTSSSWPSRVPPTSMRSMLRSQGRSGSPTGSRANHFRITDARSTCGCRTSTRVVAVFLQSYLLQPVQPVVDVILVIRLGDQGDDPTLCRLSYYESSYPTRDRCGHLSGFCFLLTI